MLIPNPQVFPSPPVHELELAFKKWHRGRDDTGDQHNDGAKQVAISSDSPFESDPSTTSVVPSFDITATVDTPDLVTPSGSSTLPTLRLLSMQNTTTCESYTLSWVYTTPDLSSTLTLALDQSIWPGSNSLSHYDADAPALRILSTTISPHATSFTWDPVDMKEGWYALNARLTTPSRVNKFFSQPMSFYISNGTDTRCVKFYKPATNYYPHLVTGDIIVIVVGAVTAAGLLTVAFTFPRLWRRGLRSPKRPRPYYLF